MGFSCFYSPLLTKGGVGEGFKGATKIRVIRQALTNGYVLTLNRVYPIRDGERLSIVLLAADVEIKPAVDAEPNIIVDYMHFEFGIDIETDQWQNPSD